MLFRRQLVRWLSQQRPQQTYTPMEQRPIALAAKYIWRAFFYGGTILFGYTFYMHKFQRQSIDNKEAYFIIPQLLKFAENTEQRMINFYKFFVDPPLDKLLPDMIPPPPGYMLPKTLVLDLKGTIVHTSYALGKGYEVMKRPGLDDFLRKMSQLYEVIIFSDEETMFTQQIAESLDPKHRIFNGRLGRESLCYRKGEFIKDLTYLNRDLKNIVVIEKSPKRVAYHAENVVVLPEFQGSSDDKFLIELIPFLEHLVKDQVRDVREEIKKFGQADTGKKYIGHLQSMQSKLNMQRQKGVGGLFQKMHQASQKTNQKDISDSQPADMSESPKPPSAN